MLHLSKEEWCGPDELQFSGENIEYDRTLEFIFDLKVCFALRLGKDWEDEACFHGMIRLSSDSLDKDLYFTVDKNQYIFAEWIPWKNILCPVAICELLVLERLDSIQRGLEDIALESLYENCKPRTKIEFLDTYFEVKVVFEKSEKDLFEFSARYDFGEMEGFVRPIRDLSVEE